MAGEHTAAADAGRVDHCALGIKVGRPDHHAYGGRKDNDATHKTPLIRRWLARHPHDILDLAFVDVAMQVAVWNCVGPCIRNERQGRTVQEPDRRRPTG